MEVNLNPVENEVEVNSFPKTSESEKTVCDGILQDIESLSDDIVSADSSIKELRVWHAKRRLSRAGLQPLISAPTTITIADSLAGAKHETACSQFGLSETHAARLRDMKNAIPRTSSSPLIPQKELASLNADVAASELRQETILLTAKLLMKEKLAALGLDDNGLEGESD
jgi:hypothetical protein